ncbi:MAG: hypothetical protein HOQ43_01025 [Glycomyces artemisiae]|uniref:Uncharacterized protein n=1 Tax=Glycomyces artemisiae TaxID=1076443 RepID=A0A850C8G5_9ACTN|nr:hypothetical protein [Glycomyces artemisiae]
MLRAQQIGHPVGAALSFIARFTHDETLEDLGFADPDNLFGIALHIETGAVDMSGSEVSLDLANLLTSKRHLKEFPDAFTAFACRAHFVDGTCHWVVRREQEPASDGVESSLATAIGAPARFRRA